MSKFVVYNGVVLPENEVRVSPDNRGMMYGDGFFDTLRSYKGTFLLLEKHFQRLLETAVFLGIEVRFGFQDFKAKILELLEANNLIDRDALVRTQCWREGERGYASNSSVSGWLSTCKEISTDFKPAKLITSTTRLTPESSIPKAYKFSNGLNYIIAGNEAVRSGGDDALMLTTDGMVGETSIANIFWIKGSAVYTPAKDCDILPGITRNLIIDLIRGTEGIELTEGRFEPEHLKEAEAVFCTNSIREIIKVESADEVNFNTEHPIVESIKGSFADFKAQNLH